MHPTHLPLVWETQYFRKTQKFCCFFFCFLRWLPVKLHTFQQISTPTGGDLNYSSLLSQHLSQSGKLVGAPELLYMQMMLSFNQCLLLALSETENTFTCIHKYIQNGSSCVNICFWPWLFKCTASPRIEWFRSGGCLCSSTQHWSPAESCWILLLLRGGQHWFLKGKVIIQVKLPC